MEGTKIKNAIGLKVTPVATSGMEPFNVDGEVGYKVFDGETIYYCGFGSYPEAIAEVIYSASPIVTIDIDTKNLRNVMYGLRLVKQDGVSQEDAQEIDELVERIGKLIVEAEKE